MELLVLEYPNNILRQPSLEITDITDDIKDFGDRLMVHMYTTGGVGLAAPQVGFNIRMIAIDCSSDKSDPIILINPIIESFDGEMDGSEGCLSFPGLHFKVKRFETVKFSGLNLDGDPIVRSADGLLSRCIQHEIEHLDGVLFIDKVSMSTKLKFNKWNKKRSKLK